MAEWKDILLDENHDLRIEDGDFVVGESGQQEVELILLSEPGEWKQHPLVGVGIKKWQNAPANALTRDQLKRRVKMQLETDGFKVNKIHLKSFNDIQVDCQRDEE